MNRAQVDNPEEEELCLIFDLKDKIGSLGEVIEIFKDKLINITHIESRRPQSDRTNTLDFYVECKSRNRENLLNLVRLLMTKSTSFLHVFNKNTINNRQMEINLETPWFPRSIRELDHFSNEFVNYEGELNVNVDNHHACFTDGVYRVRREEITNIASNYKHGQPIPRIEYTEIEINTWSTVFATLKELYPSHACNEYNKMFNIFVKNCVYDAGSIPQLEDVSNFLKDMTGFILRPVAGQPTLRQLITGLAFRVLYCTQFVRHPSKPDFTPEPDVCHYLLGHVPMLADPDFANFMHQIGLASLGLSDDNFEKLATCFIFAVEFGICKQNGATRILGGALLSSISEIKYSLNTETNFSPFIPEIIVENNRTYSLTNYQPVYFVVNSLKDLRNKFRRFIHELPKAFIVQYNPYTQSIEVIFNRNQIGNLVRNVEDEMDAINYVLNMPRQTNTD